MKRKKKYTLLKGMWEGEKGKCRYKGCAEKEKLASFLVTPPFFLTKELCAREEWTIFFLSQHCASQRLMTYSE